MNLESHYPACPKCPPNSLTVLFNSGSQLLGSERSAAAHVPYGFEPPHPGQSLRRISSGTCCSFETGRDSHGMRPLLLGDVGF